MKKYKITVFTPTYNRAYIINNLYNSLINQTVVDFEWIIIDDGSTDDTELLIRNIIKNNNKFDIKYKKVLNGGKHRAINKGLDLARGELFFIVDSDDYLTNDAIEKIIKWENTLTKKDEYAGIAGLRGYHNNVVIGSKLNELYLDCTSIELRKKNIKGDKAEVFYTDVLKKYRFPEINEENFIQESIVWYKIANDGYKIRWFNEIIYLTEYLPDGLTSNINNIMKENFIGYTKWIKEIIRYDISIKERIVKIGIYSKHARDKGYKYREIAQLLDINNVCVYLYYIIVKFIKIKKSLDI